MIPCETLEVTQVHLAKAKAPIKMVISQFDQPSCYLTVLNLALTLFAISGLADSKYIAGCPETITLIYYTPSWQSAICEMTSPFFFERLRHDLTLELLLEVHIFKRQFSSYSSFMHYIMDTSIPPYFARHLLKVAVFMLTHYKNLERRK